MVISTEQTKATPHSARNRHPILLYTRYCCTNIRRYVELAAAVQPIGDTCFTRIAFTRGCAAASIVGQQSEHPLYDMPHNETEGQWVAHTSSMFLTLRWHDSFWKLDPFAFQVCFDVDRCTAACCCCCCCCTSPCRRRTHIQTSSSGYGGEHTAVCRGADNVSNSPPLFSPLALACCGWQYCCCVGSLARPASCVDLL